MFAIGICTLQLYIPDSRSLKSKRQVIKSLKDRIRKAFNVSIAEVDEQDLWQKAILGVACVGNEKRHVNQVLDSLVDLVEGTPSVQLLDYQIEFV